MIQRYLASLGYVLWRALASIGLFVWTLVRPSLRFISAVLLLAAVISIVIDVTRWQTGEEGPMFQSLGDQMRSAAPATLDAVGVAISTALHPLFWDPLFTSLLSLPAWLTLLVLWLLISYAARERQPVRIFIN